MEILVLIFGLLIGSFLNVCISRIPKGESIAYPPSHCTSCSREIKRYDLVPVVSYLLLGGKCRGCGEKISIKYPLIELLNGVMYVFMFIKFDLSINFIFYSLLTSLLIVISMIDFETMDIFSSTIITGVVLAAIYIAGGAFLGQVKVVDNILGGVVGYGIIYIIVKVTGGMGEGDIDLAGVCGLFIGIKGILVALFLAVIIAGIIASVILLMKLKDKKAEIAFGPYIALGTLMYIFFGNVMLSVYCKFF